MSEQPDPKAIRAAEDTLFEKWGKDRPGLVRDGIVCPESYLASERKLLFIMKEVSDKKDGGKWDLRGNVRGGGRLQSWDTVARWVEGLRR